MIVYRGHKESSVILTYTILAVSIAGGVVWASAIARTAKTKRETDERMRHSE